MFFCDLLPTRSTFIESTFNEMCVCKCYIEALSGVLALAQLTSKQVKTIDEVNAEMSDDSDDDMPRENLDATPRLCNRDT